MGSGFHSDAPPFVSVICPPLDCPHPTFATHRLNDGLKTLGQACCHCRRHEGNAKRSVLHHDGAAAAAPPRLHTWHRQRCWWHVLDVGAEFGPAQRCCRSAEKAEM